MPATAFDYNITEAGSLVLTDSSTGITDTVTIFTGDVTLVSVSGVTWEPSGVVGGDDFVSYTTLVNGDPQAIGIINISDVGRVLPTSFDVGNVTIPKSKLLLTCGGSFCIRQHQERHGSQTVCWLVC